MKNMKYVYSSCQDYNCLNVTIGNEYAFANLTRDSITYAKI